MGSEAKYPLILDVRQTPTPRRYIQMKNSKFDHDKKAEQISRHGTTVEQLPAPSDNEIKVLSKEMKDFVQEHPEYTLREVSFSLWGQIEQDYMTAKGAVKDFDKPKATVETINGEKRVITHYTTDTL